MPRGRALMRARSRVTGGTRIMHTRLRLQTPLRARARRVRFGPPDRLSPLGEVYLQPTLTAGHGTGEGGSRERGGEKMVWEPDRFNARVAHRLFMTARSKRRRARPTKGSPQKRPPTRRDRGLSLSKLATLNP